jgi:hypothetical protein
VPDLFATIVGLLGIDPGKTAMSPTGRPISITEEGSMVRDLLASP